MGDGTPATPSLTRVDWFRREPGGGTLFVKPVADEPAAEPVDGMREPADTCGS
jgi:hypothetical protein